MEVKIELVETKKMLINTIKMYSDLVMETKQRINEINSEKIPEDIENFYQKHFGESVKTKHLYFYKDNLKEYENTLFLYQEELKNLKPLVFEI